jgi:hypothetical protein
MKRIFFLALLLPVLYFSAGCKKNNEVDTASLFKNTVWTGEFKYDNAPSAESYSLQCKDNGSFTWREYGGSYQGTWKLEAKLLTLTFSSGSIVKADVLDDKTLGNIQNTVAVGWTLNSGQYNTATEQALDGTTWKENNNQGAITFTSLNVTGTGIFAGVQAGQYSRSAGTVLFPPAGIVVYFSVLMPDGKSMRLISKAFPNYHPYTLTKQ